MLAVFQSDVGRPTGSGRRYDCPPPSGNITDEARAVRECRRQLAPLHEQHTDDAGGTSSSSKGNVAEVFLGNNVNGLAFCTAEDMRTYVDGQVTVFLYGRLMSSEAAGCAEAVVATAVGVATDGEEQDDDVADCRKVVQLYRAATLAHSSLAHVLDFSHSDLLESSFAPFKGCFMLLLYDRRWRRIVAARGPGASAVYGAQHNKFYWGTGISNGSMLFFSTDRHLLEQRVKQPEEFPVGGLFISRAGDISGTLNHEEFHNRQARKPQLKSRFAQGTEYFEAVHASPVVCGRRKRSQESEWRLSRLSQVALPGASSSIAGGSEIDRVDVDPEYHVNQRSEDEDTQEANPRSTLKGFILAHPFTFSLAP